MTAILAITRASMTIGFFVFFTVLPLSVEGERAEGPGSYNLRTDFHAVGDGRHDDSAAIQAWLDKAAPDVQLVAPVGIYKFTRGLTAPKGGIIRGSIIGAGPYQTVFDYAGPSTNTDLLTIGDGVHPYVNWYLSGFRITSATKMSYGSGGSACPSPSPCGAGLHVELMGRSIIENVVMDGQDGTGNLYEGFWFDGIDQVQVVNGQARAQEDAIRVNSKSITAWPDDLFIRGFKISGSGVGIHIGGGFGGLDCASTDVIGNDINVVVDNAIQPIANREIDLSSDCWIDSARKGDNVMVNDTLTSGGTMNIRGWVASSYYGNGINIVRWRNGDVEIASDKIYNNCLDGIFVQDPTTHVLVGSVTAIAHNGRNHQGCSTPPGRGWGVNAKVPTTNIFINANAWNNLAGSFAPNALGPNGYRRNAHGGH